MSEKSWKKYERAVATLFGGKRAGPQGREGPDIIEVPGLAIECKYRKEVPKWLMDAMEQIETAPHHGTSDVSVVMIRPKGTDLLDTLVVLRLRDFHQYWLTSRQQR